MLDVKILPREARARRKACLPLAIDDETALNDICEVFDSADQLEEDLCLLAWYVRGEWYRTPDAIDICARTAYPEKNDITQDDVRYAQQWLTEGKRILETRMPGRKTQC